MASSILIKQYDFVSSDDDNDTAALTAPSQATTSDKQMSNEKKRRHTERHRHRHKHRKRHYNSERDTDSSADDSNSDSASRRHTKHSRHNRHSRSRSPSYDDANRCKRMGDADTDEAKANGTISNTTAVASSVPAASAYLSKVGMKRPVADDDRYGESTRPATGDVISCRFDDGGAEGSMLSSGFRLLLAASVAVLVDMML